jgi:AmpD protein
MLTDVPIEISAEGFISAARQVASSNCDARPDGVPVELIVIHAISLPPGEFGGDAIEALFTNCLDPAAHPYFREIHALRVSAHVLIRRGGELVQFVPLNARAWHAGVSVWRGRSGCNDFSIGIELEGCDTAAFTEAQYGVLNQLLVIMPKAYPVLDVVGHSDIAPGRKTDPGPCFDWSRVKKMAPG